MKKEYPRKTLTDFPELIKQWHPTRNGSITPDKVIEGSNKRYWWKCNKGPDHEWVSIVFCRTFGGSSCPCCCGRKVSITNSLATLYPEIATQWHPTRNGDITPDKVVAGSNKKYWWKCDKGQDHEWMTKIIYRTSGSSGCPFCSGLKVSITNSLATLYPEITAQWHPSRNGDITPDTVVAGSAKKYWWKCDKGPDHEWPSAISARTGKDKGCPCCAGKKVSITNSLASLFPDIAAQWHPTRNGDITPDKVVAGSNKEYWWKCDKSLDHEWKEDVRSRKSAVSRCPFCKGRKASITNSLVTLYPEIAAQWHPSRNGDVTPDRVRVGAKEKYWWKCDKGLDHEWEISPRSRAFGLRTGCPCCSGRKTSITNSLATCFPEIAAQWHPTRNGDLTPDKVVAGSNKKHWWKCDKGVDHEWTSMPNERISVRSSGCPFCSGHRVSITNSLATLYPEIATQWHPTRNGAITPDKVIAGSNKKYWWKCDKGPDHEWPTRVDQRTSSGKGCPFCVIIPRSRTEIFIAFELLYFINFDIDDHKISTTDGLLDVDIIIRDHNLIIEYDGSYWHRDKEQQDREKTIRLESLGWNVIRVRESPLKRIGPLDVSVPLNAGAKSVATHVLDQITDRFNIPIAGLADYRKRHIPMNAKTADAYIEDLLMKQIPDAQMSLDLPTE